MKYSLSIEVYYESNKPSVMEQLGCCNEPRFEFDRLDDLVAFLNRFAEATGERAVREYANQVKLEGEATEKAVSRWGNRKEVTLEGEIEKAISKAAAKKPTEK